MVGLCGVIGRIAQYPVAVENKVECVLVTSRHPNTAVTIVRMLESGKIKKSKDVRKTLAQVS